jgi:hypothetical protein
MTKHTITNILILTCTACDPTLPDPGDPMGGSTSTSSTSSTSSTTRGEPEPESDRCDMHEFRFVTLTRPGMDFPDPDGPLDFDGEPVEYPLACNAPGGALIDLEQARQSFEPKWYMSGQSGVLGDPLFDLQAFSQDAHDLYTCEPIASDPGETVWKMTMARAGFELRELCNDWLVDTYGCSSGSDPNGTGIGAWDVCQAHLVYPFGVRVSSDTYPLDYMGIVPDARLYDPARTNCNTSTLDEACFGGVDGSSGG